MQGGIPESAGNPLPSPAGKSRQHQQDRSGQQPDIGGHDPQRGGIPEHSITTGIPGKSLSRLGDPHSDPSQNDSQRKAQGRRGQEECKPVSSSPTDPPQEVQESAERKESATGNQPSLAGRLYAKTQRCDP